MSDARHRLQSELLPDGTRRYTIAATGAAGRHASTFTINPNDFASLGNHLLAFTQDSMKREFIERARAQGASDEVVAA